MSYHREEGQRGSLSMGTSDEFNLCQKEEKKDPLFNIFRQKLFRCKKVNREEERCLLEMAPKLWAEKHFADRHLANSMFYDSVVTLSITIW